MTLMKKYFWLKEKIVIDMILQCLCKYFDKKGSSIKYVRKIFQKTNISNPLIRIRMCAYQGVRNISFSEDFAYVLNG